MYINRTNIIKRLSSKGYRLRADEIVIDLYSYSVYVFYEGKKVGCYWDKELKKIIRYGNIDISEEFESILKKIKGVNTK